MILDLFRGLFVVVRFIDDWAKARRCVCDQAIDELLQVRVQVDRLDFLHGRLHVEQEFVHARFECALVGGEGHSFGRVKLDLRRDSVLLDRVVHLGEDVFGRFLIDTHLSLDHAIVDQANKSAKTLVVVAS